MKCSLEKEIEQRVLLLIMQVALIQICLHAVHAVVRYMHCYT